MIRNEQTKDKIPDTQTDGKPGDSVFAPVHVVSMSGEQEVNTGAAPSGDTQQQPEVNFRHAQFRGLSTSTNGSSSYM